MDTLTTLTQLTIVLVVGVISSLIAARFAIPNTLFLLFIGIIISNIEHNGEYFFHFDEIFITSLGILALIMVVFDSSTRFKWRDFDHLTLQSAKLASLTFFLNLFFLSVIASFLFDLGNIYYAMIFSVVVSATSPDLVLSIFKNTKNATVDVLKFESILNTPTTVLFPFIFLALIDPTQGVDLGFAEGIKNFISQIVTGVGAGVVIGIVIFKFMRKYYSEKLSALILITGCLLTYIIAENLNGNGVLSVTVLGLFFGNLYIREKESLEEFSGMFSNSLIILVFVLLGMMIRIPLDAGFILMSLLLFVISIILRFIAVYMIFPRDDFNVKEKIFMILNTPKGIASAVVAFSLFRSEYFSSANAAATTTLHLMLVFIIYSLIVSTILSHFSKYFINISLTE